MCESMQDEVPTVCLCTSSLIHVIQRRRKQNRESQRAFRQRKERYIKTLESELENLRKNHKNLQEACQKQKEAMSRLRVEVLVLRQNII